MNTFRTFIFIRHAESESNVIHTDQGFIKPEHKEKVREICPVSCELTLQGEKQAAIAGQAFSKLFVKEPDKLHLPWNNYAWFAVRNSGFKRTRKTQELFLMQMKAVLPHLNPLGRVDVRLRERHPGTGFYMTRDEFEKKYSDQSFAYKKNPHFAVPPGGESVASREQDVNSFINSFGEDRTSELVLAFTHGGFMRALERLVYPENDANLLKSPRNCEMYILWGEQTSGDHFRIRGFEKIYLLSEETIEEIPPLFRH